MKAFGLADAPTIKAAGSPYARRPTVLYFEQQIEAFTCTDVRGAIQYGQAGDYACMDSATGNVFMIRAVNIGAYMQLPATVDAPA